MLEPDWCNGRIWKRDYDFFFLKSYGVLVAMCLEAVMFKGYFNYFHDSLLKTSGEREDQRTPE